jgi:Zn-finger nucleic acid-binding protein
MSWDPARIRRQREYGWFRSHEAEMIEEARLKREAELRRQREEETGRLRTLHLNHCPECGQTMHPKPIDGLEVRQCKNCEGIFFHRGDLETLLLRHEEHQRGFFRNLLGFHRDPDAAPSKESNRDG